MQLQSHLLACRLTLRDLHDVALAGQLSQLVSLSRITSPLSTFGMQAALKELEDAALAAERAEAGEGEACAVTDPLQADAAQPKKGGKAKGGRKITGKVSCVHKWALTCCCGQLKKAFRSG